MPGTTFHIHTKQQAKIYPLLSNNVNIPLILIITINSVVLDFKFCNLYTYISILLFNNTVCLSQL